MPEFVDRFWTSADGLTLYARDYPGGPGVARLPVVCLHGLTRNARDFETVAPRLAAQGRRVIVAEMRGRGRSTYDPDPANYNVGIYAADVARLLDALGVARAVFVGTSMGGLITMVLSATRPNLVAGAVLNDVGPQLSPVGLARIAAYAGRAPNAATWSEAVDYARATNAAAFPDRNKAWWEVFARRLFREAADGGLSPAYDPHIADAMRPAEGPPPPIDLTPLFQGLAKERPILLVRGGLSDLVDPPIVERMRALSPHMAYAEVPNVGHAPILDEPEAVLALDAFLAAAP